MTFVSRKKAITILEKIHSVLQSNKNVVGLSLGLIVLVFLIMPWSTTYNNGQAAHHLGFNIPLLAYYSESASYLDRFLVFNPIQLLQNFYIGLGGILQLASFFLFLLLARFLTGRILGFKRKKTVN